MKFNLHPLWQERHNDEHKIRRDDHRSPYQRDRARILHSAAFRRLQSKTQVLGTNLDDFHRTRLTHSLEAAQLGSGIVAQLKKKQPQFHDVLPSTSLIDSLCLAHDIGHPPYGHGGEIALNFMMRDHGGFEGNAQTFRIVTRLEPYTEYYGMNLARRTQLGLLKYPALIDNVNATQGHPVPENRRQLKAEQWAPAKGIYQCDRKRLEWVLAPLCDQDQTLFQHLLSSPTSTEHGKTRFKSLDCSIMELADDIAYGIHDLEDAIVLGLVTRAQWQAGVEEPIAAGGDSWFREHIHSMTEMLFSGQHFQRKDAIGGMVNALLTSIHIDFVDQEFISPLLSYNAKLDPSMAQTLEILKKFVSENVVHIPQVQIVEYRGQQVIMDLFEVFAANPERLLPEAAKTTWQRAEEKGLGMRAIADHISSMTDRQAQSLHQKLFS